MHEFSAHHGDFTNQNRPAGKLIFMRFSIRTLLICTTLVAIYVAFVVGVPHPINTLVLVTLTIVVFPAVSAGAFNCHGMWQAFCIGCAVSGLLAIKVAYDVVKWFLFTQVESGSYSDWYEFAHINDHSWDLAISHALAIAGGLVAVAARAICPKRER